jgi:hypothetical protein
MLYQFLRQATYAVSYDTYFLHKAPSTTHADSKCLWFVNRTATVKLAFSALHTLSSQIKIIAEYLVVLGIVLHQPDAVK